MSSFGVSFNPMKIHNRMKVFVCTDHDNRWPTGCASVVVAKDEADATELLDVGLTKRGLKPSSEEPYTLIEIDTDMRGAYILHDGEY